MTHPCVENLESVKEQRCSRIGDTSAVRENVEDFKSDTACGFALVHGKLRKRNKSRDVPD